jgi:O-antigen/teichoic acid export membrane protein
LLKKILGTTSLKANITANFVGNGWAALIALIFVPIYLKYIGAEGYGLIGIFASLQVVLSLLDSGLSTSLNKEMARLNVLRGKEQQMRNLVKTLGSVYWGMALVAGLIALCLSPLLARYWVHPVNLDVQTITYAFMLLSISLVFQFPSGFYSGGLLGLQRQVMLNVIRIVFATLKSVGALVVLVFVSKSVLAFFGWTLFVAILQSFTLKFILWHYLPKTESKAIFDVQELKNIWRFAAGMVGISLTAILLTQVDKIILSKVLSLEQFGFYTVACTLGLVISQIVGPLTQSYFPKFSALISLNKIEELKNLYHQGCQLISVLVLPATFILFFFSKELIFIWTHNETTVTNTWLVASVYTLGTGLNGLIGIPYQLTLAYSWTKLAFYQNIFFLCLMIPLTIYLSLHYGALGGALSWAVINLLYFLITPTLIHNKILKNEKAYWYWHDSFKLLLVCITTIYLAKYSIPLNDLTIASQLLILTSVGVTSLVISIFFARNLRKRLVLLLTGLNKIKIKN